MPDPHTGESQSDFMSRCVPMVIDEGSPQDQAVAICSSKWDDSNKDFEISWDGHGESIRAYSTLTIKSCFKAFKSPFIEIYFAYNR